MLFTRIYHQLDVLSPCPLPRKGPAILACNHTSGLDPLLIQSCCPRMIIWMMAREYYEQKGFNWIFRKVEAIPVERSGRDMPATREALRALKRGRILGVFPEGKIEPTRELLPFQTGVALLAARAQAPVYPCYVDGSQRGQDVWGAVLKPQRARIAFGPSLGEPAPDHGRSGLDESAARIQAAVQILADRATLLSSKD